MLSMFENRLALRTCYIVRCSNLYVTVSSGWATTSEKLWIQRRIRRGHEHASSISRKKYFEIYVICSMLVKRVFATGKSMPMDGLVGWGCMHISQTH